MENKMYHAAKLSTAHVFVGNDKGHFIYEIERASYGASITWLIVVSDVHHKLVQRS